MSDENPIYSVVQLRHFVAQPSNDDDPGWAAAWFDLGRHLGYLRRYSQARRALLYLANLFQEVVPATEDDRLASLRIQAMAWGELGRQCQVRGVPLMPSKSRSFGVHLQ